VDSPTVGLCRSALEVRRRLHADGMISAADSVEWTVDEDSRLLARRGHGFTLAVAMGSRPVPLPEGIPLVSSGPLTDGCWLPPDTAAWLLG
jgi:alpha-glucosidase